MIEFILITLGILGIGIAVCSLEYALYRWIQPWLTRRWMDKALKKIQAGDYTPPPKQSGYGIAIDESGVSIINQKPSPVGLYSIAWSDIRRVTAFKRDWLTVDCICMVIDSGDGKTTELNEEMEGWEAFADALPTYLPGSKPWADCFMQVAFPAFATNETLVFARQKSADAALQAGDKQ